MASENVFFTIGDSECNSTVYGLCDICNKFAIQVFRQNRYKKYFSKILQRDITVNISSGYGHYLCLIENQKKEIKRNAPIKSASV